MHRNLIFSSIACLLWLSLASAQSGGVIGAIPGKGMTDGAINAVGGNDGGDSEPNTENPNPTSTPMPNPGSTPNIQNSPGSDESPTSSPSSSPKPTANTNHNNNGNTGGTAGHSEGEYHIQNTPNIGAIVGGVVGSVLFLVAMFFGVCCLYRRRKLTRRQSSRTIEKEYEAEFDAEIGHDIGMLPHFTKEAGYASIPTPPPPPQPLPQAPYNISTEYVPPVPVYSDETPSRSQNTSPAYNINTTPLPTQEQDRRLSVAPTISTEAPSPMVSRNVSTVSRRDFPSISQIQNRSVLPEDDEDDYDVVSISSGPTYQPVRDSAPAAPPRLPFARKDNDRGDTL